MGATAKQQQTHPKVSEKKWATCQSCIRKRSTTVELGNKEHCPLMPKVPYPYEVMANWSWEMVPYKTHQFDCTSKVPILQVVLFQIQL